LAKDGVLVVVTFHSLEDRIAKRFFQKRGGKAARGSRHQPLATEDVPGFEIMTNKAIRAVKDELDVNPRARSARLRAGRRTDAPALALTAKDIGLPVLPEQRGR
jgi:16S rRNA (cytosine1402-N4)-methyltransferase